jgi:hypothetical protein
MNRQNIIAVIRPGTSGVAVALGLASGLVAFSGQAALAQSAGTAPFNETINGYTLNGTETPLSRSSFNTAGTINGPGVNNVPFSTTLTALSPTIDQYTGTVNGQPVNCTATQLSKNAYSLSGTCGLLSQVFLPNNPQAEIAARQAAVVQSQRIESQQTVDLISRRISDALSPPRGAFTATRQSDAGGALQAMDGHNGISGVSSGDGDYTNALWATYSHTWLANNWSALKSSTDLNTGVVGGDIKVGGNLLAGLTFTYQSSTGTTNFNDGTLDASTYTFVPYGAISFLDNQIVLDLMTGFGFSDSTSTRSRSVAAIDGSYGSDRWMLATHATFNHPVDNWNLSARLGWLMSYNWADQFTESNGTVNPTLVTRVGEISVGGHAGYTIDQFEPYVGLTYLYDVMLSPNSVGLTGSTLGRDELDALIGLNWTATDRVNASVELSNGFLRTNEDNTTVVVAGRFVF